eukprot:533434-Amorphochlora_amoeboformis.AAC.1
MGKRDERERKTGMRVRERDMRRTGKGKYKREREERWKERWNREGKRDEISILINNEIRVQITKHTVGLPCRYGVKGVGVADSVLVTPVESNPRTLEPCGATQL